MDKLRSIVENSDQKLNMSSETATNSDPYEPLESPSSAATSADVTFEPTIDELVNDFDDEQTLREEEAIAAMENDNPFDEIATLKEESEMPLEELLAKYRALPPAPVEGPPRKKTRKASPSVVQRPEKAMTPNENAKSNREIEPPVILIESGDEEANETVETESNKDHEMESKIKSDTENSVEDVVKESPEKQKVRRSHLFELYPEQNFDEALSNANGGQGVALETLYSEDEEDEEIEEEEEMDPDYAKKTIMVGSAYQAIIPGLSQYGDVLPYENEDKLVWEPSQVSEAEVEDYLLKIREIKSTVADDENGPSNDEDNNETVDEVDVKIPSGEKEKEEEEIKETKQPPKPAENKTNAPSNTAINDSDVVKDNEQALHLLVQCGYDFKEALRRKRLNAVPLTGGTMSLWSEEECQKFEEGIQKFGKDFVKIRQHQVRTRTMRELVQFYYLWKKSERRDLSFANSDTVDHMDIYLNEGEDFGSSPAVTPLATATATSTACRKLNGCNQNNFSIMTGNYTGLSSPTKVNNGSTGGVNSKKRTINDVTGNNSLTRNSGNSKSNNNSGNSTEQSTDALPLQSSALNYPK